MLKNTDYEIYEAICLEAKRQSEHLEPVASSTLLDT